MGLFKNKPPVDAEITVHSETIDATNMGDLRNKKGVLSDYEFAVAKQKLLEERWAS